MVTSSSLSPIIYILFIGSICVFGAFLLRLFILRIILRKQKIDESPDLKWIIFSLIPIIVWPIIFFASIFFFDDPSGGNTAYLLFFLVNLYPLVIISLSLFGEYLFSKNRNLGVITFSVPNILVFLGVLFIYLN
jgi:hypothetical protein